MNWDVFAEDWTQFKARVKVKWGKLTDDNLDEIGGQRGRLAGRLQETCSITTGQAEVQVGAFEPLHKDYAPGTSS